MTGFESLAELHSWSQEVLPMSRHSLATKELRADAPDAGLHAGLE